MGILFRNWSKISILGRNRSKWVGMHIFGWNQSKPVGMAILVRNWSNWIGRGILVQMRKNWVCMGQSGCRSGLGSSVVPIDPKITFSLHFRPTILGSVVSKRVKNRFFFEKKQKFWKIFPGFKKIGQFAVIYHYSCYFD